MNNKNLVEKNNLSFYTLTNFVPVFAVNFSKEKVSPACFGNWKKKGSICTIIGLDKKTQFHVSFLKVEYINCGCIE